MMESKKRKTRKMRVNDQFLCGCNWHLHRTGWWANESEAVLTLIVLNLASADFCTFAHRLTFCTLNPELHNQALTHRTVKSATHNLPH
jgi:hypothetical protein